MYTKNPIIRLSLKVACALFISLFAGAAYSQQAVKQSDVRLVIDVSGSMKKNDPNNLRQPAVELLVRLLPDGSKAGVWTFGKYVNMLIPHKTVDDQWREMARSKAQEINSVALFTNIGEALEKSAHDAESPSDAFNTSVILLTDGMVDISKSPEDNQKEWRRIVDKVLPELKDANFTIHTVALSKNADSNLLEKMALMTDGTSAIAYNAEDLMKIFLKAFDVAAPSQQVPLVGNSFAVDSSVEEFTALIFRMDSNEQTQLIGPDEEIYNTQKSSEDVSWFRTEKYDLITVKRPVEGEWKLQSSVDPDSRITIVSDMRLRVKTLPNNTFKGALENLSFVLQEDGKTITNKDFLSLITSTATMAYGPKDAAIEQVWSHKFDSLAVAGAGVFNVPLPELKRIGVYDIEILVDGKTFKRTFRHRIAVREPFSATLEQSLDENGVDQNKLTVRSHSETIDIKRTQVAATIVNPKNRRIVKPLGFTEFDYWQTLLHADIPGDYKITVQITGKDTEGQNFEYTLTPIQLTYNPDSGFGENVIQEEVLEVKAPEPIIPPPEDPAAKEPEPVLMEEPQPTDETATTEDGLPSWMMYAALALGNMVILGGGYFLFRKLSASDEEEIFSELTESAQEEDVTEPPLEPLEDTPEPMVSENVATMSMDDVASVDEEPPPMEDLGGMLNDVTDEDDAVIPQAVAMESVEMAIPPVIEDEVIDDDFGVDDLEDEYIEEDPNLEERDDMEAEMRKAQGLDLADDELDDAINNLIDDLDGSRDAENTSSDDDLDDLSGINFDEDDIDP